MSLAVNELHTLRFMPRRSADEIAEKYARNASAASQDYLDGVEAVSESPGRAAVRNRAGYEHGVRENVDKWARNTEAVTTESWKESVRANQGNYASGVANKGQQKQADFWREFGPHLDSVTARTRSMPAATPEQREARMLSQVRGTRDFRRRGAR